ncbi:hypothetical protein JMJ76_0004156, partial [Colletotrichum scovillei]
CSVSAELPPYPVAVPIHHEISTTLLTVVPSTIDGPTSSWGPVPIHDEPAQD